MRNPFLLPAVVLMTMLLAACASAPATKQAGTKVPKDVFLQLMEKQSPEILCGGEKYRTCLNVTKQKCESEVSKVAPKCTEQMMKTMPEYLASKEDGRRYGTEYGKCLIMRQVANGNYDLQSIQKCK